MNPYRLARRIVGRLLRSIPWTRRQMTIACDFKVVTTEEARRRQASGWHRSRTIRRQEKAYLNLLADMHAGNPRIDLRVAAQAVDRMGISGPSLLEIGCGSGYYNEVFASLATSRVGYTGIDYSAAAIARARSRYPSMTFHVGDATALPFAEGAFDIAFNGVSLMHILEYGKAIAEAARVARKAVIFHSVPVFRDHPTTYLHKYAYGSPVVEIVFNRAELLAGLEKTGLRLRESWPSIEYDVGFVVGTPSHAETFLCEKMT
jgi:SAM-dependent methyltransferase